MTKGQDYTVSVPIKNLSSLPLHHIKSTVVDNAGHYEVTGKEIVLLPGNGNGLMEMTMRSDMATTTGNWERVSIKLESDEGATVAFTVFNFTNTPEPNLVIGTSVIRSNITNKRPTVIPVTLTNKGMGETGRITIDIPSGQEFVTLISQHDFPSLALGDSTTIYLQFNPEGLDVNIIQKGSIAVNCANGDGRLISYNLKVVGEEQGNLLVRVEDEATIYGNVDGEHPYVANAVVMLKDYNTGVILHTDTTATEGTVLFSNIQEGYYTLFVTAHKHDSYTQNVMVSPGETTEHLASISINAISVSLNVEETSVEDEYQIDSELEYETQIPVPVVVMEVPDVLDLYSVEQGGEQLFNITLTNKGLITANNVCVSLPQRDGFVFTPLTEYAGFDLAAQQSHVIPVLVTLENAAASRPLRLTDDELLNGCHGNAYSSWEWVCKGKKLEKIGKIIHFLLQSCPPGTPPEPDPEPEITEIDPPEPPDRDYPDGEPHLFQPTHPYSQIDLYTAYQVTSAITCSMACFIDSVGAVYSYRYWKETIPCIWQNLTQLHARLMTPLNESSTSSIDEFREAYMRRFELLVHLDDNTWNYYAELAGAPLLTNDAATFNMLMPCIDKVQERLTSMHEQGTLYTADTNVICSETALMMPQQSTEWYDFSLSGFVERQKNTFRLRDGLSTESSNYCDLALLQACQDSIAMYLNEVKSLGYIDRDDMIASMNRDADAINGNAASVCATVKIQLSQQLVFTRQAFRATLTIDNSTEDALSGIILDLNATDENGNMATAHEMQINLEKVEGFLQNTDGTYSLEGGQTGIITYLFIPTRYAAPEHDVRYQIGGSLAFNDDNGVKTRTLSPATLTVRPTPLLDLTYFMQRDLYGDDPLTEEVEPIVPAEFALLIDNKGYGDATNVRMVTQQPKIVENEKGLLIDFKLVSSQVNGEPAVLNFSDVITNDFGTIPAKSQSYAQWWLTSTLMGHFIDYDVKATHVTSYGNEDLSLLDEVSIHELIHGFTPPIGTGRGFLVNDVVDADDMPDEVYLTDGTQQSVTRATGATISMLANNQYQLTITPATMGWVYGSLPDPTDGRLQIASIIRQRDGATLPIDNAWQTPVTMRNGKDPVHERSETWLVSFEERPQELVGIEEVRGVAERGRISIGPLPLATYMYVKGDFNEVHSIEVFDLRGIRLLNTRGMPARQGIYVGQLPAGVYQVRVSTDAGTYHAKVLKR